MMLRRILIDCRFAGYRTGLGRYTRNIVSNLLMQSSGVRFTLLITPGSELWVQSLKGEFDTISTDIAHYSLAEQCSLPCLIRESGADLYVSPHFNVPWRCPIPFVCVIHDLILHRYPNAVSPLKRLAYRLLMWRSVKQAQRLIAVSQFTQAELGAIYGSRVRNKSVVIGEGVEEMFKPVSAAEVQRVRSKHRLPDSFVLYVGNAKEHKNVQALIDASIEYNLVLVTGGKEVSHLKLRDGVTVLGAVEDADLPALYSAADCFVTASLYEGYGLPLLEARACGCPIVAIQGSAVSENAGEQAKLVDLRISTLEDALYLLPKRKGVEVGLPRWEDAASSLYEVLTSAVR